MNIIVNAVQATEARWDDPKERQVSVSLELNDRGSDGEAMLVRIEDNGTGMDEETRQRVFDPFYTTKDVGKGTGLGLSIVKGILDDHGAIVEVESALAKGTTFLVMFPVGSNVKPGTSPNELKS